MSLVAQEELDRLKQKQLTSYQPELRSMVFLKDEMDTILNRADLPADEKVKLFQIAQNRFASLKSTVLQPSATTATTVTAQLPTATSQADEAEAEVGEEGEVEAAALPPLGPSSSSIVSVAPYAKAIKELPTGFQKKAGQLMGFIDEHPAHFAANSKGEMTIQGRAIPHSNFTDLLRQLYIERKQHPIGLNEFLTELSALNVPRTYLSNKKVVKFINKGYYESPKSADVEDQFGTPTSTVKQTGSVLRKPPGKRRRILYLYKL